MNILFSIDKDRDRSSKYSFWCDNKELSHMNGSMISNSEEETFFKGLMMFMTNVRVQNCTIMFTKDQELLMVIFDDFVNYNAKFVRERTQFWHRQFQSQCPQSLFKLSLR